MCKLPHRYYGYSNNKKVRALIRRDQTIAEQAEKIKTLETKLAWIQDINGKGVQQHIEKLEKKFDDAFDMLDSSEQGYLIDEWSKAAKQEQSDE